jgi:hypothetical protein
MVTLGLKSWVLWIICSIENVGLYKSKLTSKGIVVILVIFGVLLKKVLVFGKKQKFDFLDKAWDFSGWASYIIVFSV